MVGGTPEAAGLIVARRIVVRPEAEQESLEVQRWYDTRRDGLGREFALAVDHLLTRIVARPLAFPRAHRETRRAVLTRFPYAIYFRFSDADVVVLAIHGRQDPSRWKARS